MEEILARQRNAAKPLSGRSFVLGVASVVAILALAQIVINLLIMATGVGLLNILFYLAAIAVLVQFMRKTVAGSVYMLKPQTLVLQKVLGDSTTSVLEIPAKSIVSIRPLLAGDRLKSAYKSVTWIDHEAKAPLRVRLAYGVSVFSAKRARKIAGGQANRLMGYVAVYQEDGRRIPVVFRPNEEFCAALQNAFPAQWGMDERTQENTNVSALGRALQRAFPELYPFMNPLVDMEKAQAAAAEIKREKQKKRERRAKNPLHRLIFGQKGEEKEPAKDKTRESENEIQDDTL